MLVTKKHVGDNLKNVGDNLIGRQHLKTQEYDVSDRFRILKTSNGSWWRFSVCWSQWWSKYSLALIPNGITNFEYHQHRLTPYIALISLRQYVRWLICLFISRVDVCDRFYMLVPTFISWWHRCHQHRNVVTNWFRLQHPSPTSM